jgi:monofunctional biosynthetic peptidoglycan transglycosylase
MRRKSKRNRLRRLFLRLLLALWILSLLPVVLWRFVDPPLTLLMIQRWFDAPAGARLHYRWVDLEEVSPRFPLAVVAAEDQKFPDHFGFDLDAIADAVEDAARGGRLRGASTLSQQVAKNVFLWPGRSWIRKALEAYYTVLIELTWGKRRILEIYVNVAEFGPLTFGVGAASRRYLGIEPSRLDAGQAALLAAVLPNPLQRSASAPGAVERERQAWILAQMRQLGAGYLDSL